jgi:hypothetical protein
MTRCRKGDQAGQQAAHGQQPHLERHIQYLAGVYAPIAAAMMKNRLPGGPRL